MPSLFFLHFQVVFESVNGGTSHADVAIDDFEISRGDCSVSMQGISLERYIQLV